MKRRKNHIRYSKRYGKASEKNDYTLKKEKIPVAILSFISGDKIGMM